MLLLITTTAFAATTAEVYAEQITASTDKAILIPVKIKNNSGVMGFKITVSYDKTILGSPKITSGDIINNGMINDSVGVSPEGTFDVVWSGTQNAVGDGTLMIISFSAVRAEDTLVKLSYSQTDTFNEAWEDIELKCSDISVRFSEEVSESIKETEASVNQSQKPPNNEEIKNAVDIALGETGKGNIDEIPEEEMADFVDRTNEILGTLTGKPEKPYENTEEIKKDYNNAVADEFIDDVKESVDSDKIESAINDSLSSVGAASIDKISADKKSEFVQKVESNLSQYAPDIDKISDKLTDVEVIEAMKQLQNENAVAATEGTKLPEPPPKTNTAVIIAISLAAVAVVTAVAMIIIKRKKNEEDK